MILSALHLAFYADAVRAHRAIFLPREPKVNVTFGEPSVSEVGGFYFRNCTVTARKCIDVFTHLVASWVIRANLQRSKAVQHIFFLSICSGFTFGFETSTAVGEIPFLEFLGLPSSLSRSSDCCGRKKFYLKTK